MSDTNPTVPIAPRPAQGAIPATVGELVDQVERAGVIHLHGHRWECLGTIDMSQWVVPSD